MTFSAIFYRCFRQKSGWGFDSHWQQPTQYEWTEKGEGLGCIGL